MQPDTPLGSLQTFPIALLSSAKNAGKMTRFGITPHPLQDSSCHFSQVSAPSVFLTLGPCLSPPGLGCLRPACPRSGLEWFPQARASWVLGTGALSSSLVPPLGECWDFYGSCTFIGHSTVWGGLVLYGFLVCYVFNISLGTNHHIENCFFGKMYYESRTALELLECNSMSGANLFFFHYGIL